MKLAMSSTLALAAVAVAATVSNTASARQAVNVKLSQAPGTTCKIGGQAKTVYLTMSKGKACGDKGDTEGERTIIKCERGVNDGECEFPDSEIEIGSKYCLRFNIESEAPVNGASASLNVNAGMPGIMEDMGTIEFTDACNPHKQASCSLPDTLSAVLPLIPSDMLGKAAALGVDPSAIIADPAPLCAIAGSLLLPLCPKEQELGGNFSLPEGDGSQVVRGAIPDMIKPFLSMANPKLALKLETPDSDTPFIECTANVALQL